MLKHLEKRFNFPFKIVFGFFFKYGTFSGVKLSRFFHRIFSAFTRKYAVVVNKKK